MWTRMLSKFAHVAADNSRAAPQLSRDLRVCKTAGAGTAIADTMTDFCDNENELQKKMAAMRAITERCYSEWRAQNLARPA